MRACVLARAWTAAGLCVLALLLATTDARVAAGCSCRSAHGTGDTGENGESRSAACVQRLWCTLARAAGWCAAFHLAGMEAVGYRCRVQEDGAGNYDVVANDSVWRRPFSTELVVRAPYPPLCTARAAVLFADAEVHVVQLSTGQLVHFPAAPTSLPVSSGNFIYWIEGGWLCSVWAVPGLREVGRERLPEGNWDADATIVYPTGRGTTVSLGGPQALDVALRTLVGYSVADLPTAARPYREVVTGSEYTCRALADGTARCYELEYGRCYAWGAGFVWAEPFTALNLTGGHVLPHRLWLARDGVPAAPVLARHGRVPPIAAHYSTIMPQRTRLRVLAVLPRGLCTTRLFSLLLTLGADEFAEERVLEHYCAGPAREWVPWDG